MMIPKGRENCASRENLWDETQPWQKIRQRFNPFYALIEAPVVAGAGKGSHGEEIWNHPKKVTKNCQVCVLYHINAKT